MARLQILTPSEVRTFETPPVFTASDRELFFQIPASLHTLLSAQRTVTNRIGLLITIGYFRATKRFFTQPFPPADIDDVAQRLGCLPGLVDLTAYDAKATTSRHRQLTLTYLGFRPFDEEARLALAQEIHTMIRSQQRLKPMFFRAVAILATRKIEIPSVHVLTSLIASELRQHRQRLAETLAHHLSPQQRTLLATLVERPVTADQDPPPLARSPFTLLKRFSHSTRPSRIKANLEDRRTLLPFYRDLAPVLAALDLTPDGVRYYAKSVVKARPEQVSRRTDADRELYLVCFIAHQFRRLHDLLGDLFLLAVQHVVTLCVREHKERYYNARTAHRRTVRTVITEVNAGLGDPLTTIETIAFQADLAAPEKVQQIQTVFTDTRTARSAATSSLHHLHQHVQEDSEEAEYYAVLTTQSLRLQNRVAEIVREVEFQGDPTTPLMQALAHYQAKVGILTQSVPTDFLSAAERQVVYDANGKLKVSLYKALLYLALADALKTGTINLKDSYKYRSLDDYLIPKGQWTARRTEYLQRADLLAVADGPQTLQRLAERLEQQYQQTNHRILQGENPHVHFHKDGSFHVTTPAADTTESESVRSLLPGERYISLVEVLSTETRLSHFLEAFSPWQLTHTRARPSAKMFFAGIVGYGCFIGISKLARISKGMKAAELETTVHNYFTLENLHAANDRLFAFMSELELPQLYRRHPGQLHTSSDGAKFGVAVDSLNANYSFKYLGKDLGVSAYTFIDERHFSWHHNVISATDREAPYVIDGLMHNEVIQSDIHSTDTHGYSEVVFGALHLLGFTFAPRLANLPRRQLYAFRRRREYVELGYKILPTTPIDESLILPQWDEMLRFIATIQLKETTASQLFRRLNSYSKHHPLYQALKEFGKIPKSAYILRIVDELALRQAVEKQLNKGENSQQFSRAVGFGHNQDFLYGDKIEQEIAEGCRRLIKNAIVCWNYL
ncbi:MAG: Tn3 family transposase [Deltaproteobacteria bacterium]|nr:Tn3 family transposase [Deltaproteobacteria bacterium]